MSPYVTPATVTSRARPVDWTRHREGVADFDGLGIVGAPADAVEGGEEVVVGDDQVRVLGHGAVHVGVTGEGLVAARSAAMV